MTPRIRRCTIAALGLIACQSVTTIEAEEPITPISMILVNPSAFHRKLLKVEGIAKEVRPYATYELASICGARFKVTDDTGTIEVSFRQKCQAGEEKAAFVNEGARVVVEGSMEAPSSMIRNSDGTENELALQARSVVPSKK